MSKLTFMMILIVAFLLFIAACIPLAAIWSLNVLFALAIPVEFETWLAMFCLLGILGGVIGSAARSGE